MKILIFLSFFFFSCSSLSSGDLLDENTIYKKDMIIEHEGKIFEGVAVLPLKKVYNIKVTAHGNLDVFHMTTCNRDDTFFKKWNVDKVKTRRLFGTRTKKIEKPRELDFEFKPNSFEQSRKLCPVDLTALRENEGRHSWGYIDFYNPRYKLSALSFCNGEERKVKGVHICQSKSGLIQKFSFDSPIKVSSTACVARISEDKKSFTVKAESKRCHFKIEEISNPANLFKLTLIGYDKALYR